MARPGARRSQTIKNLETQGYLTRLRSEADGRSTRLDLADKARAILVNDHFEAVVRAADALCVRVLKRAAAAGGARRALHLLRPEQAYGNEL